MQMVIFYQFVTDNATIFIDGVWNSTLNKWTGWAGQSVKYINNLDLNTSSTGTCLSVRNRKIQPSSCETPASFICQFG